ncbi:hypothetical protein RclHR1_01530002 [Rhizophagus clarus]|uniref:Ribonuclease H-like domain-containing protein n=1 Tax=Rhizophagus clarus TaxID=94130 RepID=A0A2Z6QTZ1_9GLOM|nr:hypothetical protein RclHR1_01530002 [Rhizophagus clarus]GES73784.1 ribonuclease H-like domain-containing protein [Rhizophagus clarus]
MTNTFNNPPFNSSLHSCKFLDLFFLDSNSSITLNQIAHLISNQTNITFYTDGSCFTDHSTTPSMGLRWIITNLPDLNLDELCFSCKANKFPSSTKAEALALASALAVCPPHASVIINTDSKCIIDTFNYLRSKLPTRKLSKSHNYLIWQAVFKIIQSHHLSVILVKVKAHSNDQFNDKADVLANQGRSSQSYIDIRPTSVNLNAYYSWNLPTKLNLEKVTPLVIDRNIRHAIADITSFQWINKFLAHHRITDIRNASYNNAIDWKFTREWFNHNPVDDSPTSRKLTKFRAWQIKNCSNLLPTMDIMAKYNPDLFKDHPLCWHCSATPETNSHLWLCPIILKRIKPLLKQLTLRFIAIVQASADTLVIDISNTFRTNPIFGWSFKSNDHTLPATTDHAFYLTCRGFCTNVFTSIFTKFFIGKLCRKSNQLLLKLFSELSLFLNKLFGNHEI